MNNGLCFMSMGKDGERTRRVDRMEKKGGRMPEASLKSPWVSFSALESEEDREDAEEGRSTRNKHKTAKAGKIEMEFWKKVDRAEKVVIGFRVGEDDYADI